MKKSLLLGTVFCCLLISTNSNASQLIYTFTTTSLDKTFNYNLPTYVGLEYRVFVDTERSANYINVSGDIMLQSDLSQAGDGYTYSHDSFYTNWIGDYHVEPQAVDGTLFEQHEGRSSIRNDTNPNDSNSYDLREFVLWGGKSGHGLQIVQSTFSTNEIDFSIGSSWIVGEWFAPTNAGFGLCGFSFCGVYTNAILSNVEYVPIPSSIWLFGSGLIGLLGFAKRKSRA